MSEIVETFNELFRDGDATAWTYRAPQGEDVTDYSTLSVTPGSALDTTVYCVELDRKTVSGENGNVETVKLLVPPTIAPVLNALLSDGDHDYRISVIAESGGVFTLEVTRG